MRKEIGYYWESRRMESIGPGDSDVYTQNGRFTEVEIVCTHPEVIEDHLQIGVTYDVKEGQEDYTNLQMIRDIEIPLPGNWKNVKVLDSADFHLETVFYGKNHKWNPVKTNLPTNQWIRSIYAKIDGIGDDEGNAGLRINFSIPVEYKLEK